MSRRILGPGRRCGRVRHPRTMRRLAATAAGISGLVLVLSGWAGSGAPGRGHEVPAARDLQQAPSAVGDTAEWIRGMRVDRDARSVELSAVVQAEAFNTSLPPDHQYHALVNRNGSAAPKALFVTSVPDSTLARVLRELGADDGGGVPMAAWTLRWVPFVSAPASRVAGTRVDVRISWDGSGEGHSLEELLHDPGGRGIEMRFGGNEEHAHEWDSGCILCLFSCPGGVASNAAYTIRDHQRAVTHFAANEVLPPDGTEVRVTLRLLPD